jgi:cell division protein FtsW
MNRHSAPYRTPRSSEPYANSTSSARSSASRATPSGVSPTEASRRGATQPSVAAQHASQARALQSRRYDSGDGLTDGAGSGAGNSSSTGRGRSSRSERMRRLAQEQANGSTESGLTGNGNTESGIGNTNTAAPDTIAAASSEPTQGLVHDFQEARLRRQRLQEAHLNGEESDSAAQPHGERRVHVEPNNDPEYDRRAALRAQHVERHKRKTERAAERQRRIEVKRAKSPACHWGLFVLTALLAILSIPIVYSASTAVALDTYGKANFFLIRQAGFVALGIIVLLATSRLSQKQLRVMVWVLYAIALVGLFAIDFTPLGFTQSGVRRWIKLPGLPPQQFSELAKIALIGVMADFWSRAARASQTSMIPWAITAALTLPLAALVVVQPHLSAALLLCALPLAIAFYADAPMKQVARLLVPVLILGMVVVGLCAKRAMPFLPEYQQERIAAHFSHDADAQGSNYQTLQSQRTLMSGGILGRGPGESLGKQGHLPEPHTDFILAVIGEEYGLVGTFALMIVYGLMIFFCFHVGHCADSMFEALLCAGVGTLLAIQVICNTGVATGVLPVTGMPLPLLSYGGSGLLCLLIGIGMVLAVSRRMGHAPTDDLELDAPASDGPSTDGPGPGSGIGPDVPDPSRPPVRPNTRKRNRPYGSPGGATA